MNFSVIVTCVIAVIALVYVLYVYKNYASISDDVVLQLQTTEDKLATPWYKSNVKQSMDFTEDHEIAKIFIQRNMDMDVDSNLLVLGYNLKQQYVALGGKGAHDYFWNIRDIVGYPGEIALVHDPRIRNAMHKTNNLNLTELKAIMDDDLETLAKPFIEKVLQYRWDKLESLNNQTFLNKSGSYLYIDPSVLKTTQPPDKTERDVALPGNITAHMTEQGIRVNLLCNELEFETLIKRLGKSPKLP